MIFFGLIGTIFGAIFGIINFFVNIIKKIVNFVFEKGGLFVKILQSDAINMKKMKRFDKNQRKIFKMNDEL